MHADRLILRNKSVSNSIYITIDVLTGYLYLSLPLMVTLGGTIGSGLSAIASHFPFEDHMPSIVTKNSAILYPKSFYKWKYFKMRIQNQNEDGI